MSHEIFEEFIAAESLGALSADEAAALKTHLDSGCAACASLRASFAATAHVLAESVPLRQPPARLKVVVMQEVRPPAVEFWPRSWHAIAAAALLAVFAPTIFKRPAIIGTTAHLQGDILINGKKAADNSPLRAGDVLTTILGSSTELKLEDKVLLKIKPNSQVRVRAQKNGYQVQLVQGGVISLVKTGTHYTVITPMLKADALGTGFFVNMKAPDKVYVCICAGHIALTGGDFSKDMHAEHHQAVLATEENNHINTAAAGLEEHSDAEVGELLSHFQ